MVNLTFNAIDVETANRNRASICQIGIAQVRTGKIHRTLSILVNPEEPFEHINTGIHGIDEDAVRDADTFPGIYSRLRKLIERTTLVSHTPFDRQALEKATSKYELLPLQVRWLDSAQIARGAWPEKYKRGGWSLKKIMADLNQSQGEMRRWWGSYDGAGAFSKYGPQGFTGATQLMIIAT